MFGNHEFYYFEDKFQINRKVYVLNLNHQLFEIIYFHLKLII